MKIRVPGSSVVAGVALIAVLGLYGLAGITSIEPGEVGILIKMLGSNRGMQEQTLDTGTHWVEPISYDVATYDVKFKQYDEGVVDMPSQTKDGQPILVDLSLEIGLADKYVPFLHENVGTDWYANIVYPAVRSAVRNTTTMQKSDQIYTGIGRANVQKTMQDSLDTKLDQYGILLTVNLRDIEFTNTEFIGTLEKKAIAAQNVIIEERNADAAQKTAIKMANLAEGAKQERIKAAEAQKEEQKLDGEGRQLLKEADAKGILAIAKAEAEGVRLRREALSGSGGKELVQIEWARNLGPNVKVYMVPTGAPGTTSLMDINGMMQGVLKGAGMQK